MVNARCPSKIFTNYLWNANRYTQVWRHAHLIRLRLMSPSDSPMRDALRYSQRESLPGKKNSTCVARNSQQSAKVESQLGYEQALHQLQKPQQFG
jgi:hypothetical protein